MYYINGGQMVFFFQNSLLIFMGFNNLSQIFANIVSVYEKYNRQMLYKTNIPASR